MGRARALLSATLIAAAALATVPSAATAVCRNDRHPGGNWPRMGYELGHTRHQPAENTISRSLAATLTPAWSFSANEATGEMWNEITAYPIVANGCVYVGSSRGWNVGRQRDGWAFALNADGGDLVWKTRVPRGGGIFSTAAVHGGVAYFFVSKIGAPYVLALDAATGKVLWTTTVDRQPGSDAVSSPIVYDGMVWVGVSGTAAEGDEATRFDFRGASVVLRAGRSCSDAVYKLRVGNQVQRLGTDCVAGGGGGAGRIMAHAFSIPDKDWQRGEGDAGGAIWSTISIEERTGFGYVGTGNPFNYESEHANTNALIKIDMRRRLRNGTPNPRLGRIVGSYKGDVEEYFPELADNTSCDESDFVGFFLAGFECGRLDLDFGAAPNVFTDRTGRVLVGEGQKSGVYHVVDPKTMEPVWTQIVGVPSLVGGIVGTPAFDGTALYAPHTIGGYLVALDRQDGSHRWVSPTADGVHWGPPVTSANGILYTVDLKGFLDAYDAATGAPLLHRPMGIGANTGVSPTLSWGGVSVARNTVYASVGVGLTSAGPDFPSMPDGFVIAYRPARVL